MRISSALIFLAFIAFAHAQEQEPASNTLAAEAGAATTSKKPASTARPEPAKTPRAAARADRLDLETTVVTGNRELPKVLYIVPWKKAELGELPAQPFNTLLDEVLTPVDREEFKREVKYFDTVTRSSAAAGRPDAER